MPRHQSSHATVNNKNKFIDEKKKKQSLPVAGFELERICLPRQHSSHYTVQNACYYIAACA